VPAKHRQSETKEKGERDWSRALFRRHVGKAFHGLEMSIFVHTVALQQPRLTTIPSYPRDAPRLKTLRDQLSVALNGAR
jgi:hypothetical protein